jgi:TPR repeat protein
MNFYHKTQAHLKAMQLLGMPFRAQLALLGENPSPSPLNDKKVWKVLRKGAKEGDADVQEFLAVELRGSPEVRDKLEALYWFKQAAKNGRSYANMELSARYCYGWPDVMLEADHETSAIYAVAARVFGRGTGQTSNREVDRALLGHGYDVRAIATGLMWSRRYLGNWDKSWGGVKTAVTEYLHDNPITDQFKGQ